jgi:hypothetical protein
MRYSDADSDITPLHQFDVVGRILDVALTADSCYVLICTTLPNAVRLHDVGTGDVVQAYERVSSPMCAIQLSTDWVFAVLTRSCIGVLDLRAIGDDWYCSSSALDVDEWAMHARSLHCAHDGAVVALCAAEVLVFKGLVLRLAWIATVVRSQRLNTSGVF